VREHFFEIDSSSRGVLDGMSKDAVKLGRVQKAIALAGFSSEIIGRA